MSRHTIAEAQAHLAELIDRARNGEEVVITDGEKVVAHIGGAETKAKVLTDQDLDWMKSRRAGRGRASEDAGTTVSRMRDEEWTR